MIDRFEKFSLAISELNRNWHRIAAEEMEAYGLKSSHAVYLTALARSGEGLTAPRLCEIVGKDKADVSRMMNILILKGLAEKKGGHHNGYGGAFTLTKKGREAAEQVSRRAALAVELAGQDLSPESRENFYEALDSIVRRLRELCRDGLHQA